MFWNPHMPKTIRFARFYFSRKTPGFARLLEITVSFGSTGFLYFFSASAFQYPLVNWSKLQVKFGDT